MFEPEISVAISLARILGIYWIFSYHYLMGPVLPLFFGVDFAKLVTSTGQFYCFAGQQTLPDGPFLVFAHSGWSGNILFFFVSGFSLWFATENKGRFSLLEYLSGRIRSVYIGYVAAAVISYLACILLLHYSDPQGSAIVGLVFGAPYFVPQALKLNQPLWFITPLLLFYLAFPLLPIIRRRAPRLLFIPLLAAMLILMFFWDAFLVKCLRYAVAGVLFAACFSAARELLSQKGLRLAAVAAGAVSASFFVSYIYLWPTADPTAIIHTPKLGCSFAVTIICLGCLLPAPGKKLAAALQFLARGTFAVFLFHYMEVTRKVMYFLIKWLHQYTGSLFLIMTALFVLSLCAATIYQLAVDRLAARLVPKTFPGQRPWA